jgi:hypothetical protein
MVVTDQSNPTAPADIFPAPEKENFKKKNPRHFWKLNHSISNNRKLQAAIRSMDTRPKINAANTEKNQDLLSISSPLFLFRRKAPKASNLFFPPFNPV